VYGKVGMAHFLPVVARNSVVNGIIIIIELIV